MKPPALAAEGGRAYSGLVELINRERYAARDTQFAFPLSTHCELNRAAPLSHFVAEPFLAVHSHSQPNLNSSS